MAHPHSVAVMPSGARRAAARRLWRLLLVVFLNGMVNMSLFFDLESAFLMSLVTCPEPTPDAGHHPICPVGSSLSTAGDRCEAELPESPKWSYSKHCASKHVVLNGGRTMLANLATVGHLSSIVAVLFLGPLVDAWGRKNIMILALFVEMIKAALQFVAALMVGQQEVQQRILIAGMAISRMFNNFPPAMRAMAADLSSRDEGARSAAFALIGLTMSGAIAIGFAGGFFILELHLTNYAHIWLGSTIAGIVIILITCLMLKETVGTSQPDMVPSSESEESDNSVDCAEDCKVGSPLRNLKATCGIFKGFMKDCLLAQMMLLFGLLAVTKPTEHILCRQLLLGPLGYSQAAASLLGIILPALAAGGNAVSSLCVRKLGTFGAFGLALILQTMGLVLTGLCMPFEQARDAIFWAGMFLVGVSFGMALPVAQSIVSVRVGQDQQGMLFSLVHLLEIGGEMLGLQLFVKSLYNADYTGWRAGEPFFAAAGVTFVCLLWLAVLAKLAGQSSGEEESSEASDSDELEK